MTSCRLGIALISAAAAAVVAHGQPLPVSDDFECYEVGAPVSTLPGWERGGFSGRGTSIADAQAFSGLRSVHMRDNEGARRAVGVFSSVHVTYSLMTYVPSTSVDMVGYVVAMAKLVYPGWPFGRAGSTVSFDTAAGIVKVISLRVVEADLILDRWAELRVEVDLPAGDCDFFYDGRFMGGVEWVYTGDVIGPPVPFFEAIEFGVGRLGAGPGMYVDDVIVTEAGAAQPPTCGVVCYADCDVSGATDFFDFLCYQNLFAAADARADCDGSGALDIFDFLCFQNEFAAGCG